MLTNNIVSVDIKTGAIQTIPALALVAIVAGSLAGIFYSTWRGTVAPPGTVAGTTTALGGLLMTAYMVPFEIVSVILLVALIGAAKMARRHRKA
jgi:NADH-quinone oxidoreductase subunit J